MPDDNDPRRRLVRGGALLPVAALMTLRALTRLNLLNIPPLNHWYVYAALLGVGFMICFMGSVPFRAKFALRRLSGATAPFTRSIANGG